ncbi:MAG: c-type cytochrome [Burkholderiales bacterium]
MKSDILAILIAALAAAVFFNAVIAHAADAEKLNKDKGCSACHALDKKLVGPAYQEIAAKYNGDAGAQANLEKKVRDGGSGVWGAIPMPPHKGRISDAELTILVSWVLAR